MSSVNGLAEILKDLWGYCKATKNIFITLLIAFFLLLGLVIVMSEGSAVMPFIYTIF